MTREAGALLEEVTAQENDAPDGPAQIDRAKQVGTAGVAARTLSSDGIWADTVLDSVPPLLSGGYKLSGAGRETNSAGSEGFTQQETVNGRFSQQGWELP
jgi:hypothetical protein